MDEDKLDDVIHFRISRSRKTELQGVASSMGISLGEVMRRATDTVEALFDPDLTLARLIELSGILKD